MTKTLVLGASEKPSRYSNMTVRSLRRHNQAVAAIGLREVEIGDVQVQRGQPNFNDIHTVTLYINPKRQPEFYDYIVNLRPERVIFNPGTENPEFYKILKEQGITVETACTLVMLSTNQY